MRTIAGFSQRAEVAAFATDAGRSDNPVVCGNMTMISEIRISWISVRGVHSFFVKRFPFLDWMRGLAVVIMIQCHTFNSFTRTELWQGGPYVLSQFVGGMAAPLFLFMAGRAFAVPMGSLERPGPAPPRRCLGAPWRARCIPRI